MPRLSIQKAVSCTHAEYARHAGTKAEIVRYAEDMAYVNVFRGVEPMETPLVPEYVKFCTVRQALLDHYGIELPYQKSLRFTSKPGSGRYVAYTRIF